MKIYLKPQPQKWPVRGGVRTHLFKLWKHLSNLVELVDTPGQADVVHVESSWPIPKIDRKVVFVCHGGFLPFPGLPVVKENLEKADVVVSVSKWIADKFFPQYHNKTKIIYNGVDLEDFQVEPDLMLKDYILYAKEWNYYFDDFLKLARDRKDKQFVTTIWPQHLPIFDNVIFIGLQPKERIISYLKNAGCLLLTGSEVCPTMLLEAWGCKIPVLAKNIDGSKELMMTPEGIKGGYLYENYQDSYSGLDYVLENKVILGEQGYTEVSNNYQWSVLANKYMKVYEELLNA